MSLFVEAECYSCGIKPFRIIDIKVYGTSDNVEIECRCSECSHPKTIHTKKKWWFNFVSSKCKLKERG